MKTSKRKRSSKAASVAEASGVDVVAAEVAVAAEPVVEAVVEAVAELSPAADVSNEAVVEQVTEVAAEAVSEETVVAEPVAEAVVTEAAAPAVVGEPLVVLGANCSVKDAAALKTSLCAFSTHSEAVTLDVSAVERVDTATMQLLCAFVRDRGGRNQGVTWRGESPALQDAVRLLGVGALLGLETKGVAA
jgi:ABC-type transporter Mla MlaB component